MENQSLWFQVLIHFDRKSYFSNGLTIPFLLGANSIINPDDKRLAIDDLFEEIIDESLPRKISLQRCGNIGEYVIGIFDNESVGYLYREKPLYKQFGNLYITDNSFSAIDNSDTIKSILISEYQNLVDSELFSINQREWGDYSEKEKSQLEELK